MVSEWIACLDKRPTDRTGEDLDIIYSRLKDLKAFERFHPMLLQQICYYSYYEDLEQGVILFRQGDIGTNWYAVLSGSLEVSVSETGDKRDALTLCTLGIGTAFGESILSDAPRHATVVTSEHCELLRVEQKDFKVLWEVIRCSGQPPQPATRHVLERKEKSNRVMMDAAISPLASLPHISENPTQDGCPPGLDLQTPPVTKSPRCPSYRPDDLPNPAAPITAVPSERLARAGRTLRTVLLTHAPHMIRDRKFHLRTYRRCMLGGEMVDWMMQQGAFVHSRNQAVGMWQALLEEGVIVHVCREHQFKDKFLFYRFHDDDQGVGVVPTHADRRDCEEELPDVVAQLAQIGPDAMMRMILRKPPQERTMEDLEIIYEELLHIKALSHLSTMVKRELASVLVFESHTKAGTVLFNQGDEGKSWYIILKGSVNVVIYGKGVVCTLHEGDDFGKLALVNDAPRAATIVLREDNCHFLRVDKEDFNRILRDVEANTVRLKEHGQDVLVLEKIPTNVQGTDNTVQAHYKYSVMAGTPEKMLEHLLETRIAQIEDNAVSDTFLEDFLLTHVVFMPSNHLCPTLMAHYHTVPSHGGQGVGEDEYGLTNKRKVVQFVEAWSRVVGDAFWEDRTINAFLEELYSSVFEDSQTNDHLRVELTSLEQLMQRRVSACTSGAATPRPVAKSRSPVGRTSRRASQVVPAADLAELCSTGRKPIKNSDENLFKVYWADHTYTTLRVAMEASVEEVVRQASDKLGITAGEELVLCEVKSSGERVVFKDNDLSVTPGLSLNGRLFITPREHIDALTPLPEQEGPTTGTGSLLEVISSREIAYQLTLYDWELFYCIHEYELIYLVFGRAKFGRITSNLDLFLRRFNEIQFWVVTEMCLSNTVSKRVQLLRKFIKIASYCKEYQNLNSFFAIVMGLSNIAVSRLSQTWEKLPNKFKKMFATFEMMMDPSRNHRAYRLSVAKMEPPIIPFMPLLMKDMTFTHEGNKTHFDGLVNFEKMHMVAQTLRTVQICRSKPLDVEAPPAIKNEREVRSYTRNLKLIDNQRVLTQISHKLEPRRS